jgi:hypothetical protein
MSDPQPKKPWWRKTRAIAFTFLLLAGFYLLTFVPTCWALLRIDPATHPAEWSVLVAAHRPTAALLMACPETLRDGVIAAVNYGRPEDGWTMYENSGAGMGIGMQREESPTVVTDVRLW